MYRAKLTGGGPHTPSELPTHGTGQRDIVPVPPAQHKAARVCPAPVEICLPVQDKNALQRSRIRRISTIRPNTSNRKLSLAICLSCRPNVHGLQRFGRLTNNRQAPCPDARRLPTHNWNALWPSPLQALVRRRLLRTTPNPATGTDSSVSRSPRRAQSDARRTEHGCDRTQSPGCGPESVLCALPT